MTPQSSNTNLGKFNFWNCSAYFWVVNQITIYMYFNSVNAQTPNNCNMPLGISQLRNLHLGCPHSCLASAWRKSTRAVSTPFHGENAWGGKKTPRTFAWPFFCYRFFFFLIVLQGIVITVTNIIDLVLQTIFCMTSLPNSITSNIISRGRRLQSRRRQRCSRRQRQRQLRRGQVLEKRTFLLKPYRFGYRSVIVLGYVFPAFFCMLKLRCSVTRRG